jgi:hypothetical protein
MCKNLSHPRALSGFAAPRDQRLEGKLTAAVMESWSRAVHPFGIVDDTVNESIPLPEKSRVPHSS